MYLSQITGNILNKFNNQPINVWYEPQSNMFDVLLSECGIRLFSTNNYKFGGLKESNLTLVNNMQQSLFNYNVGLTNSILKYSSNKYFSSMHLNSIICTHSYKPEQIKKEDLVLLNNNLSRELKIFFSEDVASSWKMNNRVVFPYGIPTDVFYDEKNVRNKRILLLNLENLPNIEPLAQFLGNHEIEVDILTELNFDTAALRKLFNQYSVCVDLADHNIVNLLTAIACGCKCVTYATRMIIDNYSNTPNLYVARTVEDLILSIKQALSLNVIDSKEHMQTNHPFGVFKQNMLNIIEKNNSEVFLI